MNLFHGTEYVVIEYPYEKEFAPGQTGIWKMDMETGKAEMVISLAKMATTAISLVRGAIGSSPTRM